MTFQKIPIFLSIQNNCQISLVLGVIKVIAKRFTLENSKFFFKMLHLLDIVIQSNIFIEIMRETKTFFFIFQSFMIYYIITI